MENPLEEYFSSASDPPNSVCIIRVNKKPCIHDLSFLFAISVEHIQIKQWTKKEIARKEKGVKS